MLFEDEITDTKAQTAAITLIAGTLETLRTFTEDSFNPLSTKYVCMFKHLQGWIILRDIPIISL